MADVQTFPSTHSLESDPYTTRFGASATLICPGEAYSGYGFLALLGLAQRLRIDLLPITWQAPLGLVGQSRAKINQAPVNIQTSFAFKRFDHADAIDPLRETVQEMVVLSHQLVQFHPHIVKLIGICWDIPKDDQVWPVLVFENAHLGDLCRFARFGKGRDLALEDKLKICTDVGIAIGDMHISNIIHGDIKPQNVLIFEDRPGIYTAKVADFGFSTHFHGEQDLIKMPKSEPWNAPEHHYRYFCLQDAKAMDVYSFGMLCLWLLFGTRSYETMPYSLGTANNRGNFPFKEWDLSQKEDLLLSWKSNQLLEWATRIVAEDGRFTTGMRDRVAQFFRSTLCLNPQTRITDWRHLLSFLSPARGILSTAIFNERMICKEEDFQIAPSIASLYSADFRIRTYIATNLEAATLTPTTPIFQHISVVKAAEQLALCYEFGFGLPRREEVGKEALISRPQSSAVKEQVQLIKNSRPQSFSGGGRFQFYQQGFVQFVAFQYYNEKGLISRAEDVVRREIQDTKEVFGEDHWLILNQRSQLANILSGQGRWEAAEELEVEVMETSKKIFGLDHPSTLASMANLASTYWRQGQWEAAEELEVQVLETRKTKLGLDHPSTLASMANIAATYRKQGRWKAAEELEVEVMETSKKKFGLDHPDTLASMASLGVTFTEQGRWEAAEELFIKVVETSKKKLGLDHPNTLISIANLAETYRKQGRWKAAEELEVEVMETSKKKLGLDHPSTLARMANLALTYWHQGQWEAAKELFIEVVETSKKKLGLDHPDTLARIANLASTYRIQSQWEAAEKLDIEVVEISKKKLGLDHPNTLASMANLASTYWHQGQWEAAEELEVEVMETSKKRLGLDHPDTLVSIANLASTYRSQGRWEASVKLSVEVIEISKMKFGPDHPDTLTNVMNLASTYSNQGRWDAAEELSTEVVETSKKKLGLDHPNTLTSMANLAVTYSKQGRWKAAEELEVEVMETSKRKFGLDHPNTLTSMSNLAFTWKGQGRDAEAIDLMRECVQRRHSILGVSHPHYISSLEALAKWEVVQANVSALT